MLAAVLLTGCSTESGPTAATAPGVTADAADNHTANHYSEIAQIEETVVNPCNGEAIHFSGTGVGQWNFSGTQTDLLHREVHAVIRETGIGEITGATYTLRANYHEVFQSPTGPALDFTFGLRDRGNVTSSTPALSFTWLYTVHFVRLPSGEFKVTKDIETDDHYITACRG